MTEPDQAIIARLSSDFAAIAAYLARASGDLRQLERIVGQGGAAQAPAARYWQPPVASRPAAPAVIQAPAHAVATPPAPRPAAPTPPAAGPVPRSDGWLGKALAVAGVAVTLVGVALLLALAAQAGILRPEFRVGAGAVLAAGLVGAGWRLDKRTGGRVGAIALAATGVATAYIDAIAVTTIYDWVSAPVGLTLAAVVAVVGLLLARRWDSQQLGLLVLVPLIGLAPVVTDGVTLLLVGFMLALAGASLPVQLGKDWLGLHAARTAAATLPLLVALAAAVFSSRTPSAWLAVACAVAATLAIGGALVLLRHTANSVAMALFSAVGTMPVLAASWAVERTVAALMAAALAGALLAIVLNGGRLPWVTPAVRAVWSALAAVSTLIAVTAAFDGPVAGPVLLALAAVLAIASGRSQVVRWCAVAFGVVGGVFYLGYAPLSSLFTATVLTIPIAVSTLIASLLVLVWAFGLARSWSAEWAWATAVVLGLQAVTMFSVTAGVLLGGQVEGFFAGHMAATVCWIVLAAVVLRYAARAPRAQRSVVVGGGATLVAAAVAKLFLFDLGTLDGIFRVAVFIVVGLALLGMGAGYARLLAQQDELAKPASR